MASKAATGAAKTRKPASKARKSGGGAPWLGHLQEIVALALVAMAILVLLALLSYSSLDSPASFSGAASPTTHNLVGPFGAVLADALIRGLGVGAYGAVALAGLLAFRLVFRRPEGVRLAELLSWALIGLSFLTLLPLLVPDVLLGGTFTSTGGILGIVLSTVLQSRLGTAGAVVVALLLFLVTLKIGLDLSYAPAGAWLGKAWGRVADEGISLLARSGRLGGDMVARGLSGMGRLAGAASRDAQEWWMERARVAALRAAERESARLREMAARQKEGRLDSSQGEERSAPALAVHPPSKIVPTSDLFPPPSPSEREMASSPPPPNPPRDQPGKVASPGSEGGAPMNPLVKMDDSSSTEDVQVDEGLFPIGQEVPTGKARIVLSRHMEDPVPMDAEQLRLPLTRHGQAFELPGLGLLDTPQRSRTALDETQLQIQAVLLEQKLLDYGVEGKVVEIHPGPVVTMFEFEPAPGIRVSKIANLSDDLSMALKATRVRIVAPLPGKGVVGIEVPNDHRETVYLREILAHEEFLSRGYQLPIALGKDIVGKPTAADWTKMPHLLIAGTTGSGKSVSVNSIILSILMSRTPDEVRMILVDPKMLEFSLYDGIPHLLLPVVTSPKKAATALKWGVEEMARRYRLLAQLETRNIIGYNQRVDQIDKDVEERGEMEALRGLAVEERPHKLPYIVIVIDELADLMMVAAKDVQDSIVRLAQMARAAGIHLLLATQRPSVDVITGLIKANFPARVSFRVSSKIDSRTILDSNGAEDLLGQGDMLFLLPGKGELKRIHGAFVSDDEVKRVITHLKSQAEPQYLESILEARDLEDEESGDGNEQDECYDQAVAIVAETRAASTSMLQRRLKIGYNRAARIIERMEKEGVVGPADGAKPREVYAQPFDFG